MRQYSQHRSVGYAWSVLWLLSGLFSPCMSEEEECLYDQSQQYNNYIELVKQYPNSQYSEEKNKIIIPVENGEVHLRIGGCVHYGVTIQMRKMFIGETWPQKVLFARVAGLLSVYAQGMADANQFMRVIEEGRWTDISGDNGDYYFIGYPGYTSFEVYQWVEGDKLVVGVSFYN